MFPTLLEQIKHNLLFIVSAPIPIIAAIVFLRIASQRKSRIAFALGGCAVAFTGIVLICLGYSFYVGAWFGRNLYAENIAKIRVRRLKHEESRPAREFFDITEKELIQKILIALNKSTMRMRNHESYGNGFHLEFFLKNSETTVFISAFRDSNRSANVNVLVPSFFSGDRSNPAGEYSSKEFLDLITGELEE